ncbi:MAG TPA: hypothetical protein DCL41_01245 [Bdellovibrionales bacterium]|nr:hypothetical protein [Pseudobdellovibrionaceae bacterium]HAG90464.1 hypothetical protein [Bdellovibrionales bacterium]|tara:strand:- start:1452 stop:1937 length:486 start_codon:yes stop_codon:yes gene_type:complete
MKMIKRNSAFLVFAILGLLFVAWVYLGPQRTTFSKADNIQKINEVGLLGTVLLNCADSPDRMNCPSQVNSQSALSLMPKIQAWEDDLFKQLAPSSPQEEAKSTCSEYCSCSTWARYFETQKESWVAEDSDLLDLKKCPSFEALSKEKKELVLRLLESLYLQ